MHDCADVALAGGDDADERLAVEAQRHRPPQVRVVEGRRVAVDDHIAAVVGRKYLADRLRRLLLDVRQLRECDAGIVVGLPRYEGQEPRRDVLYDGVLNAVEVGLAPSSNSPGSARPG